MYRVLLVMSVVQVMLSSTSTGTKDGHENIIWLLSTRMDRQSLS